MATTKANPAQVQRLGRERQDHRLCRPDRRRRPHRRVRAVQHSLRQHDPDLLVGDYLFVSKYSYGYSRFSLPFSPPLFSGRIFGACRNAATSSVFKYPRDNSIDYIKRIIGLPGDHIQVRQGQLYINGERARASRRATTSPTTTAST